MTYCTQKTIFINESRMQNFCPTLFVCIHLSIPRNNDVYDTTRESSLLISLILMPTCSFPTIITMFGLRKIQQSFVQQFIHYRSISSITKALNDAVDTLPHRDLIRYAERNSRLSASELQVIL